MFKLADKATPVGKSYATVVSGHEMFGKLLGEVAAHGPEISSEHLLRNLDEMTRVTSYLTRVIATTRKIAEEER